MIDVRMLKLKTMTQKLVGNHLLAVHQQCPHFTHNKTNHKRRYFHKRGSLQNIAEGFAKITVSDWIRSAKVDSPYESMETTGDRFPEDRLQKI